ncbi:acyl-CoA dehydrogenase family protein [Nocardioides panzhihuensis]|uniref:Alkylation response protein AidB-like acyl-CoA dehydrogenase n=1 Tax=Nocardioides panzhihuensis TaxID=860243 RepID=A0A7Z0IQ46_9ACTN|nr:acyl-CoA dehydrogenase family protein [Nocardioides panzhihuensis]NYI75559.1 alkylation response protein AidB-like acyl-CoA dehydrogenase [Nocardioides panzhihuensis]
MRIETAEHLEAFRTELRAFIAQHSPGTKHHTGVRAPADDLVPAIRSFTAALFDAGYLGADWPEEHGGRGAAYDSREAFVVAEEIALARTWAPIGAFQLAAPALIDFGTDEQRAHFLPRIRNAEDIWCQLFSEPGAGSDLASLKTRARLAGDHWVIDGQKVWTTNGQLADVGYLLARTDPDAPKHKGITAFALDMRTPGVDVRPLREITGSSDFNEVFLDSVRIPVDRVIGEVNNGWRIANSSLAHERSGVASGSVELVAQLQNLVELASGDAGEAARDRLGRLAVHVHVTDAMSKAVQSHMLAGTDDASDAPLVKIFFSETNLAMTELGIELQGAGGIAAEGDADVAQDGWWQDAFLYARAYTIAGGANEVLKNVVAERALGMPR